jgi:hypothetical protein
MMHRMRRSRPRSALFASLFLLAACGQPSASFRRVELAEARHLVRAGVQVVDASGPAEQPPRLPGGIPWRLEPTGPVAPPELPDGPVLVVSGDEALGFRGAAALARNRNHMIYVLITTSAEERGTLYALDPNEEENPRGRDS